MTVDADPIYKKGIEQYGASSIVLHPTPLDHRLIDDKGQSHTVVMPGELDIFQDRRGRVADIEAKLRVLSGDSIAMRFNGEREQILERERINRQDILVNLPGIHGDANRARVRWARDLPIISQVKRGVAELRRRARLILG